MRYFIGILLVIFIILLGLMFIFRGHGSKTTPNNTPVVKPLPEYANTDAQVSTTIDGAITGDDTHRAIRITVSQNERLLEIIQGYSGNVISSNASYNTEDAYNVFLNAIALQGFTLNLKPTPANQSPIGKCPDGNRYIFQLTQNGETLKNLWTTNCGTKLGNFGGNAAGVLDLFEKQITNYDQLTANVQL